MKNLILMGSFLLLTGTYAGAQGVAVTNAFINHKDGKLDKAKEEIDKAITNDKTKAEAKTWYFRGLIYRDIANSPLPAYKALSSNALGEAYTSYKKAMELDTKKGEYYKSSKNDIDNLWGMAFNDGVLKYQNKQYAEAVASYDLAGQIKPGDTTTILYTAYAAEAAQNFDRVKQAYRELFAMGYKKPEMYRTLAGYERSAGKNDEAMKVIEEGRKAFPQDKTLAIDELAMISQQGKLADAQSKIEEAIKLDPKNASLYATLGSLQDQAAADAKRPAAERAELKQKSMANYQKTLELDPNNVDANFNLGVYYYNEGVAINKKVNNMTLNEYNKTGKKLEAQAKELYSKALPYFEKVYSLQPDDKAIRQSLKRVYVGLGRKADADKIKE